MKYIKFNRTELEVCPVCLGTVNYGTSFAPEECKRQLDQYIDMGGNFIDTAHVYGDWEPEILSRSERVIGDWIKQSHKRGKIILATKGAHPLLDNMDCSRVNPSEIEKDLEESLSFLHTDYIDIYFLHRDDPSISVEEIIDFLDQKVREGKIRYYGCSNWSLKRIMAANEYAQTKSKTGFICNQLMWSLADIHFNNLQDKTFILMDEKTYTYHKNTKLNAMAYMSIAKGYFSRKSNGEILPNTIEEVYGCEENDAIYNKLLQISGRCGLSVTELSFLYFTKHDFQAVPIASFDNCIQLEQGMRSFDVTIEKGLLDQLNILKKYIV